jgi:hypothetical protein
MAGTVLFRLVAIVVTVLAPAVVRGATLRYWIEPCARPQAGCTAGDVELAVWAFEAWQRASQGALTLERSNQLEKAHIRVFWAGGRAGLYGEARPISVEGVRGAEVYVLPPPPTDEHDALLRDTVVYLTCLHETGHALGLQHTAEFADIMYSFQFGGDIPGYFNRYRRLLTARGDIRKHSGMSPRDVEHLGEILRPQRGRP